MNHHPTLSLDTILHRSPTKQCGIAPHIITSITVYSCETMQEAGILLRLPQTVIAHAQVLFHRFYTKRSMTQFDTRYCSVSCLFLASKLNEKIKSVQSVLEAFDFVFGVLRNEPDYYSLQVHYQHQSIVQNSQNIFSASSQNNFSANPNVVSQLMQSSMTVLQRKNEILRLERIICAELGFILHNVSHAQTYILFFAHILELSDDGRLVQCAWNFCNDALKSSVLCLHVKPHVIACSAIFMAAKRLRLNLPQNPAWWLLFDTELEQILFVEQCLNELYEKFGGGGGGDSDVVLHENDENESAKVDDENGKREKRVNRARYHYILTRSSTNGIGGGSSSGGDVDNNNDGGVMNDALYMDPQQLQSIKHEIELAKARIEQQKREQREQREEEERQRRQQQTLSSSSHHGTAVVNDGGDGNGYRDDDYEYESYNNGNKRYGDHHRNRYVDRHHRGDEHQPQYHHHRSSSSSRGGHHSSGGYHYDDHYRRSSHASRSYDERERTEDRGERQEDQWSRSSSGNDESRSVGRSSRRHYAPRSSSSGASGSHDHASSSSRSRTSSGGSGRDRHDERDRDGYSGSSASSSTSSRKRSRNDDDGYR